MIGRRRATGDGLLAASGRLLAASDGLLAASDGLLAARAMGRRR